MKEYDYLCVLKIKDYGKVKIKQGTNRIVFLIGKYAIKIPNFKNGQLLFLFGCYSNCCERDFCKKFKCMPDMYEKVVPSLFCSWFGLMEIQYRCKPVKEISISTLKRLKAVNGETKSDNYGIYKNKIVCVDYK